MDEEIGKLEPFKGFEFDAAAHEGKRVKIEKVEIMRMNTSYNEEGIWVEGLRRDVPALRVSTETVANVEINGEPREIRASMIFRLKEATSKDGTKKIGWGQNPRNKLFKFLKKMKVNTPQELLGQYVTITTRQVGDREFLGFVVE